MNAGGRRCVACGTCYGTDQSLALLCCPLDPAREESADARKRLHRPLRCPTGWCAWCGKDVTGDRTFCDSRCSIDFHDDVNNELGRGGGTLHGVSAVF